MMSPFQKCIVCFPFSKRHPHHWSAHGLLFRVLFDTAPAIHLLLHRPHQIGKQAITQTKLTLMYIHHRSTNPKSVGSVGFSTVGATMNWCLVQYLVTPYHLPINYCHDSVYASRQAYNPH